MYAREPRMGRAASSGCEMFIEHRRDDPDDLTGVECRQIAFAPSRPVAPDGDPIGCLTTTECGAACVAGNPSNDQRGCAGLRFDPHDASFGPPRFADQSAALAGAAPTFDLIH